MQKKFSKSKCVIITGGSSGIGFELLKIFLKKKYKVINIDKKKNEIKSPYLENIIFDLTKTVQIKKIVKKIFSKYKNFSILINNAKNGDRTDFLYESIDNWDKTFDVNLKGHFFLTQELIKSRPNTKERLAIINISSVASNYVSLNSPSYHFSKAGIDMMTKYLAHNLSGKNIFTYSIKLGMIIQKRHNNIFYSKNNKSFRKKVNIYHNAGRHGNEIDIFNLIGFLGSSKSDYLNGNLFNLTGGSNLTDHFYLLQKLDE